MHDTDWHRLGAAAAVIAAATLAIIAAVSPAGAQTAGLDDVPQDAYYAEPVAELHAQGIFGGTLCNEGFCPSVPVDRKTMAVWTVRVVDGQDPSLVTNSRFGDVDALGFYAPFIERLAELGVTAGCGDGTNYCPDRSVNRAEMAVFLSRAFDLPIGPDPGFSDTPSDAWYAAYVASLTASGVTAGCGDGSAFCPSDDTTRGQMATFLWRAESGSLDFSQYIDVMLERRTPPPLLSVDLAAERSITVTVHYCGQSVNFRQDQLRQLAGTLTTRVGGFFREQSAENRTYDFQAGQILLPDSLIRSSVNEWHANGNEERCMEQTGESADSRVIVLADTYGGGYAWLHGGPAFVSKRLLDNENTDAFYAVVAHELGHAFENLRHPWSKNDFPELCQVIKLSQLSVDEKADCDEERKTSAGNQVIPAWRVDHMLGSVMSYSRIRLSDDHGRVQDLGPDGRGPAYIACYQKAHRNWGVTSADCERDGPPIARVPAQPEEPVLTSGTDDLLVDWDEPDPNGSPITDYDVQYSVSSTDVWIDWPHDGTSITGVIEGLRSETTYHVRVRAVNGVGPSLWSPLAKATTGGGGSTPRVILEIGDRVQGRSDCTGAACRWLHVTIENFGPGPHTLACAHNGVEALGFPRGVWHDTEIARGSSTANRMCYFGYPGSEVFVIVGAEYRDGAWQGGYRSNIVEWQEPGPEPPQPPAGAVVNDDPELYDNVGTYNWWIPPEDINGGGYGTNGFHFTLAAGNSNTVDSWARWDFGSVDGRYEIQAHIPSSWATAHVQYRIVVDGRQVASQWIDQEAVSGGWMTLGAHDLRGQLRIEVRDSDARDDYRDDGPEATRIAADAIRLLPATDRPPDPPASPSLVPGDGSIAVSWSAPPDNGSPITGYQVDGRPTGGSWTTHGAHTGERRTQTIVGLDNGATYQVRVRARNANGWSEWSTPREITLGSGPFQSARVIGLGGARVAASLASGDVHYYRFEVPAGGRSVEVETHGDTDVTARLFRVAPGTVDDLTEIEFNDDGGAGANALIQRDLQQGWHLIAVMGFDSNVSGSYRISVDLGSVEPPDPPNRPTLSAGNRSITVSWSAPSDNGSPITGYEIQQQKSPYWRNFARTNNASASARSYTLTGLDNGATYQVRVRAINANGPSDWSPFREITLGSVEPPDAPTVGLRVVDESDGTRTVVATWTPPDNDGGSQITNYRVTFSRPGRTFPTASRSANARSHRLTNASNNTTYTVQVQAENAIGVSPSARRSITTGGSPPPDAPTLTVRRGGFYLDTAQRWVVGSGSNWPAGEQFWIKCGTFVDTSRNRPVTYRDRYVDSNGNLSWGESICASSIGHTVEVWTQSGARKTVTIGAP